MSYSTLQPHMELHVADQKGYIGFNKQWGNVFALSDPICSLEDRNSIVDDFLKSHSNAAFIQVSEGLCRYLHEQHGYYYTQIGCETWFDLTNWSLSGRQRKLLRKYNNRGKRLGVETRSATEEELTQQADAIVSVKKIWKCSRVISNRQLAFLVRPEFENETDSRRFLTYYNDNIIQYTVCDPIYESKAIIGYNINLLFYNSRPFSGVNYFTITSILDILRSEGYRCATLGLAPFLGLSPTNHEHFMLRYAMRFLYEKCAFIYNFKGLVQHKKEYNTEQKPTYYASPNKFALTDIVKMMKLCNAF